MLIQRRPVPDMPALGGLAPLLARLYAARHIQHPSELNLDIASLLPPSQLKGISGAVDLLLETLNVQGRILIVSDFDADGATSCALVIRALQSMGFKYLDYIVPDRFAYGYGLSPAIVAMAQERDPALIITVDNGISSHEGVQAARAAGIKVLITDHHLPGADLPAADAIVNPNQSGCTFPSKALAGVGVVFYLMLALRARLREKDWFASQQIKEPRLADLLDLVALGTVADLVALDQNNRTLVSEGLRRIRQGRACPGILALLEVGKRSLNALVASDLGFAVGPRLNAAGRLEDMSLGIACLLTEDPHEARQLALRLDAINDERKRIESDMKDQAMLVLSDMEQNLPQTGDGSDLPAGLCLYDAAWHQGVIGIVAARVKEKYHRPVIVFADAGANGQGVEEVKGSARSIAGLHIRDLLDEIASLNPGLISKFGGHAMAAGLSLDRARLDEFRVAYEAAAARHLDQNALQKRLLTDGEVAVTDMQLETAELIRSAGPWGQGFPEPLFEGVFECLGQRLLGEKHIKFVLSPLESPATSAGTITGKQKPAFDAIAFNVAPENMPVGQVRYLKLVYRLDVNEYRGQRQLQLMIEHFEVV
ncbi:MAG: single-stranded-DNA-specific exonuclease RecJ [Pseudohongiella sp.]|nr:single-stranded-DNA-specific exonuclease RecJ [Pseudohongiella sp.]